MKTMTIAIVALFATAAIASGTATTAPAAATTPAAAPAAATAPATTTAAAPEHKDCAGKTGAELKKCETEMKKAAKKH